MTSINDIRSIPIETVVDNDNKNVFKRFADWITLICRDFLSSLEKLFAQSETEWTPLENSQFLAFQNEIRQSHLDSLIVPSEYITGDKKPEELTEDEKNALLERIESVKRDFYQNCLDHLSGIPSNLDGNTSGKSLLAFIFDLNFLKKERPEDPSIDEMLKTFMETYKFVVEREAVDRLINKEEQAFRKEEYIQKVEKRLKALQPGERFVYQVSACHHAMLFEFKVREVEGKRVLDIKLINSGDGVEHHYSKNFLPILNPSVKFQSYLIEGVEQEAFLSTRFVSDLVEQEVPGEVLKRRIPLLGNVISYFASIHHELVGIGKIYRLLKVHAIHNAHGKKVISDDPRMHHKPQNRGTCSRRIYEYWMRENLSADTDYHSYLATSVKAGLVRLKVAEAVENRVKGTTAKVDSLKDRLFVQPHALSLGLACIRNQMKTRTMVLLGEQIQKERIDKAFNLS